MTTQNINKTLNYRDAGVDIDAGKRLVNRIKTIAKQTANPDVIGGIGHFAALYELPLASYRNPVLVSSTDGVGTKLKLAIASGCHDTIGIDLVAMCVNDVIVCGAQPLFFLDYYATGKLDVDVGETIVSGIGQGCVQAGVALVGGETAEMPDLYAQQDYDLAGFCLGVVDKRSIIKGDTVTPGCVLIGIASSGVHANGYTLIRNILKQNHCDLQQKLGDKTLIEDLLTPTRIYVKPLLTLIEQITVHAIAHITGGGLLENIARVIPNECKAVITANYWQVPEIFQWLQQMGNIDWQEMYRTFNCGVGMVVCVAEQDVDDALNILEQADQQAWPIGCIAARHGDEASVTIS